MIINNNRSWKPNVAVGSLNFGATEESLFLSNFKRFPDEENVNMPDGTQQVWQFDNYGLQIWISNGKVVTAICSHCD